MAAPSKEVEDILKKLDSSTEQKLNLETEYAKLLAMPSPSGADLNLGGAERNESVLRELDKKIKLENAKYEELMLELAALKKSTITNTQAKDSDAWNNNPIMPKTTMTTLDGLADLNGVTTTMFNLDNPFGQSPLPMETKYDSKSFDDSSTIVSSLSLDPFLSATNPPLFNDPKLPAVLPLQSSNLMMMPPTMMTPQLTDPEFTLDDMTESELENQVDMLDIPGKGRCSIYLARYSYDPYLQSLNDNPEYELPLTSGDYVLIWGLADEDGYFAGELLDGRRGLVPSNFVEKLCGEDLLEFHRTAVLCNQEAADQDAYFTVIPEDIPGEYYENEPAPSSPEYDMPVFYENASHLLNATFMSPEEEELLAAVPPSRQQQASVESPGEVHGSSVPAPRHLTLERQLNKSILISWSPPDAPPNHIEMYHVYVDGFLRTTVKASDKTKALVEAVDSTKPHRISVRSVLVNKKTSKDAACTMIIGKDAPLGPSCVRATNITSTSAIITWLPSNSNFQHTVCINSVEVRTVKPGVFRHSITGLTPNTYYKVTIRAKNIRASPHTANEKNIQRLLEKLSAHTEFKTLSKALPDPPMDVRVDGGPQDGTLLVTWIPVPQHSQLNLRVAPVTGYAVFADGKRVTDVDSPTSDHALIDLGYIGNFSPKLITVRSKSRDLLSEDSMGVTLQGGKQFKRSKMGDTRFKNAYGPQTNWRHHKRTKSGRDPQGQVYINYDEDDFSDKEMYARNVPAIEITRESPDDFDNYTDEDYDERKLPKTATRRKQRGSGGTFRVFVALYDYDPLTMSPNPEACDEELSFTEGQLIKVIGEKDADGFYYGESHGNRGFVPCNMVTEVQVDDDRFLQETQMHKEQARKRRMSRFMNKENWDDMYTKTPVRRMIALYDYDPQELSPNVDAEVELKFRTGDLIDVYGDMDDDGFFLAELRGARGLVPSNFLTEATTTTAAAAAAVTAPVASTLGPAPTSVAANLPTMTTPAAYQEKPAKMSISGASGPPPPPREPREMARRSVADIPRSDIKHLAQMEPQRRVEPAKPAQKLIDLDRIPGLDDDFDDIITPSYQQKPMTTATTSTTKTTTSTAGAKTQEGEGGLLGGLSQLTGGGVSGLTGKLGDLAGSATSAGGGLLSTGRGLFKKFGF